MSDSRAGRRLLVLGAILAVSGVACLSRQLEVGVGGCRQLNANGLCEVEPGSTIWLWVNAPHERAPLVRATLTQALPPGAVEATHADVGWRIKVRPPVSARSLLVIVAGPGLPAAGHVLLRQVAEPPLIAEARKLWHAQKRGEAERLLDQALALEHESAPVALARYLRSRIRREDLRPKEEREDLRAALEQARDAHMSKLEVDIWLALPGWDSLPDAEAIEGRAEQLATLPGLRARVYFKQARLRLLRGQPRAALAFISEGERWATRLGDDLFLKRLATVKAEAYEAMGQHGRADREFQRFTSEQTTDCGQAFALYDHGRAWLGTLRATPGTFRAAERLSEPLRLEWLVPAADASSLGRAAAHAPRDPRPMLRRALALFQTRCAQVPPMLETLTLLTLAEALFAESTVPPAPAHLSLAQAYGEEASRTLRSLRGHSQSLPSSVRAEWIEAQGRLALMQGRLSEASQRFEELRALSTAQAAPGLRLLSMIGLARAASADRRGAGWPRAAELLHQAVQTALDQIAAEVPLGTARESFLGQFDEGTGEYLLFLHEQGRDREGLALARQARLRELWDATLLGALDGLPQDKRQRWETLHDQLRQLRQQIEDVSSRAAGADTQERTLLFGRREQLLLEHYALLGEAAAALGLKVQGAPRPRALRPGEATLLCHPTARGWLCYAEDASGTTAVFADLRRHASRKELTEAMIAPLWSQLRQAEVIRFLGHRRLPPLDLHLLPVPEEGEDSWLGDGRDVVDALDLEVTTTPAEGSATLVIIDPRRDLRGRVSDQADNIRQALERHGHRLKLVTGGGDRALLARELPNAGLLVYLGHAEAEGGGHLQTENAAGFLTADVLLLKVPSRVALLGCETGVSSNEWDEISGLGLAQAFILRGAGQVLATARAIKDGVAAQLARDLMGAPALKAGSVDLRQALRQTLRDRGPGGRGEDIGGVRVLVP